MCSVGQTNELEYVSHSPLLSADPISTSPHYRNGYKIESMFQDCARQLSCLRGLPKIALLKGRVVAAATAANEMIGHNYYHEMDTHWANTARFICRSSRYHNHADLKPVRVTCSPICPVQDLWTAVDVRYARWFLPIFYCFNKGPCWPDGLGGTTSL